MEKAKSTKENELIYKRENFVPENRRVKMSFSYPEGELFGDFYRELVCRVKEWAKSEYFEYSGRGITYAFSANVTYFDECFASVICRVSLCERGTGHIGKNVFAQNFLNGKLASLPLLFGRKNILQRADKNFAPFFMNESLSFVSNSGEIRKTDAKISQFYQKNSAHLLKKST
jgi:hypothetical protein